MHELKKSVCRVSDKILYILIVSVKIFKFNFSVIIIHTNTTSFPITILSSGRVFHFIKLQSSYPCYSLGNDRAHPAVTSEMLDLTHKVS